MLVTKVSSELPSVEDTIARIAGVAVSAPKEPGAIERTRHDLIHMPFRSWCFSGVAGRGVDDPHVPRWPFAPGPRGESGGESWSS